jgi:predicted GIY-YIG superfamily endonuclease
MTENKYNKSKIYTIRTPNSNLFYIGSTTQPLHKRYYEHKQIYKDFLGGKNVKLSSIEIFKLNDTYIELLEDYNCSNKRELEKREGELIRQHKENVVNKYIAGRNPKEYYIDNKDKIIKFQIDNKDKYKDKWKQIIKCECGLEVQKINMSSHRGAKIHNVILNNLAKKS